MDDAYKMGRRAFKYGYQIGDNPFKNDENDCDDYADWNNGYKAAAEEAGEE